MYKKLLSDFSSGINLSKTALQLGLDSNKTPWASGLNVEIYNQSGVCRQNGNMLITTAPDFQGINSLFTFAPKADNKKQKILYSTTSGKFYEYDCTTRVHKCLKKNLSTEKGCIYTLYIGGVAIANGVDEPFFYSVDEDGSKVSEMNTVSKDGETPIIAEAICSYKSRLWLAAQNTLYYSALGTYNDWTSTEDAGYISNFHCDEAPITALKPYKDYIAIYKQNQTYLLSGSSPDDFAVIPFADKGAASQDSVVTAANKQFFFSDALFTLEQTGILAQITLGNEASLNIKPVLNGTPASYKTFETEDADGNKKIYLAGAALDKSRLSRLKAVPCERKNQLWFYIPTQNNDYINNIWIYDWLNSAWTLRALPQPVLCAAKFGDDIICATQDGKILLEDYGPSFDGLPIQFEWKSPFLTLGNPNSRKLIDYFYFLVSDTTDNNFIFSVYKDYDSLDAQDQENINVSNSLNMLWASEATDDKKSSWAEEPQTTTSSDTSTSPGSLAQQTASNHWAISSETVQKAEISNSCIAIQICIEGTLPQHNFALIGLEYKEITPD